MKAAWQAAWVVALVALGQTAQAQMSITGKPESPRTIAIEIKLGGYKPLIDREASLTGRPYDDTFGATAMLLGELEFDRMVYQGIGNASVGFGIGYAEKWASATVTDSAGNVTASSDRTGFFVLPLRLLGVYRFDYWALKNGIPLAPYGKVGLVYTPWWTSKGSGGVEFVNGQRAAGGKWGYQGTVGLALLLDVLEPRLARDLDVDIGVNHTYLFAEFTYEDVNNFGGSGLDLSSRHFMFGLNFEL